MSGKIWIATNTNGLLMVDQNAGNTTTFTLSSGLPDMIVYTVNEKNGSIYVGTGLGLAVITPVKSPTSLMRSSEICRLANTRSR